MDIELDYATSNITNSDDLREKIHEIHNYMRNNGIGYGLTSLKVFNLFYGLMKIEEYNLNEKIGLNDEISKFSYLLKLAKKDKINAGDIDKLLDIIYNNKEINLLIANNIPTDLRDDVYNQLIIQINSIKEIEKSSKEQLSGKIYEYFVGRDQSAISELGAYFTNRRIVDFIINKIKPQIKVDGNIPKMIDMFGGSGGFTIGYIDYLNQNYKINWKNQLNNIYHIDINEDVLKSARLEFFCLSNGIIPNDNNIKRANSFKHGFDSKYDLILTNPPYGGDKIATSCKKEKRDKIIKYIDNEIELFKKNIIEIIEKTEDIKSKNKLLADIKKPKTKIDKILDVIQDIEFLKDNKEVKRIRHLSNQKSDLKKENKIEIENNKRLCVNIQSCSDDIHRFAVKHKLKGTDKEACSLMLIMNLLNDNGTAVGVLKEGLFFDSAYSDLRKVLLQEFNVKEIISVPSNQFENTSTKTSIIIFTKEEQKTSQINFSELKVNLYDKDEFIEKDNKIYLKYNKGDIINVEEIFIKSVSINEIISNENISLNHKDYNKIAIECGEDFKLVKIKDICEFLPKSKRNASFGKDTGLYNFHSSSYNIKKCDEADYEEECIIIGNGGVANIKIDNNFSCSDHNYILKCNFNNYIYYILLGNIKLLSNGFNGSTLKNLSKNYLEELEIPIPKSAELIEFWVNKISTPYNLKQEKEKRLKEVENEIQIKIKDIQQNQKCEEVKLGDICEINPKNIIRYNTSYGKNIGKYNFYTGSTNNKYYCDNCNIKTYTIILNKTNGSGKCNIFIDKNISCAKQTYICQSKNKELETLYIYYYLYDNKKKLEIGYIGACHKNLSSKFLEEFKIKLPIDKSLIDNLQPLFDEVEELQKEIRGLDETYNNYLQELSKSAIKNQEILNGTIENEIIYDDDEKTETNSDNSLNLDELKEQCKSLGIKKKN